MTREITASRPENPPAGDDQPAFHLSVLGPIELAGPDGQLRAILAQPKRVAVLVYIATGSRRGFVRRDALLPIFWPEHDQSKARTSLRQALRFLRGAMGADVFDRRGDEEVALRDGAVAYDVAQFERAIAAGRLEDALDAYRGDFLAGFFVAGSGPELDQWLEDERARIREVAMRAASTLSARAEAAQDQRAAARWARRAVGISPHDESAQRNLIRLLDAAGDRAGALHAYDAFARRLARDLDAEPAKETQRLVSRLKEPVSKPVLVAPAPSTMSIAVVPFTYQGPEDERHLGHALAEEIREALRRVPELEVASQLESIAIASSGDAMRSRLRARTVLSGQVERDGSRLTVAARLSDATDGRELWSDRYAREMTDVFAVQERLVRAVVGALRISLVAGPSTRLIRQPTQDLVAYNLYLRGRYHWMRRPRETRKGLEYFERAIARDPLFALAHAGIADVYNTLGSWEAAELPSWEAFPRAHAAAMQALALDPELAEAHTPLAYANMHYLWRWSDAGDEFRRATALNPAYSHAHHWHSHYLMALGRVAESLDASRRALELDPLDLIINVHLAWHHWLAREYDEAVEQSHRAAELEPNDPWPSFFAGMAHAALGDVASAVTAHRLAVDRCAGSPVMLGALGFSLAAAGERREAERVLSELRGIGASKPVSAYEVAVIHAALGDSDAAFDWLDRAYEERSAWLAYLAVDPRLDELRRDERFHAMTRAVGLPTTPRP